MINDVNIFEPTYDIWVRPIMENFPRVMLSNQDVEKLDAFVQKVVDKKNTESRYINDPISTTKRFTTGFGAEMAVGKYLGMNILDFRVGDAAHFDVGDLSTIGLPYIGVKAIEYNAESNKFPIVHTYAKKSEILCFKHPKKHLYMIAGLFTPDILETYSDRSLIWDPSIPKTKTCFYGIPFSKRFEDYSELEKLNTRTRDWLDKEGRL
jgi:hypothetical protein